MTVVFAELPNAVDLEHLQLPPPQLPGTAAVAVAVDRHRRNDDIVLQSLFFFM